MRNAARKHAWIQGVGVGAAATGIAIVLFVADRQPYERETLAIEVSEVRSYATEAQWTTAMRDAGALPERVARAHTAQILERVRDQASTLDGHKARAGLDGALNSARALSRYTETTLAPAASGEGTADPRALWRIRNRLDRLEHELWPSDG